MQPAKTRAAVLSQKEKVRFAWSDRYCVLIGACWSVEEPFFEQLGRLAEVE